MKKFIFFWLFFIILTVILIIFLYVRNIDYINETFRTFQVNTSHESGFYEEEFYLELTTPRKNATIYYTLDGSNPNPDNVGGNNEYYYYQDEFQKEPKKIYYQTYIYQEPLLVNQELVKNNNLHQKRTANTLVPDIDKLFKSIVIKAKAVDEDDNTTDVTIKNYFVDENIKKKFQFPIISIITEPGNLMDYYEGIYVPGELFDLDDEHEGHFRWREANYHQRGHDWEKEAIFQYFIDSNLEMEQNIGIRIHGGATRSYSQKSLRLYAREEYGNAIFNYDFFNNNAKDIYGNVVLGQKRLILRNSGNDWSSTMFRDMFMQSLVKDLNFDTQSYQPSIVFINGEYWGIHNIRERYDRFYLESNYKIDTDNIVILIRTGRLDEGETGDEQHYHNMLDFIQKKDITKQENYEYINTLMDIKNHINYYISNIYFNNTDWPGGNIKFWRKITDDYIEDAPYGHDGRWRWLLYDTDFGFQLYGSIEEGLVSHNNIENAAGETEKRPNSSQKLLNNLLKNEIYRNRFVSNFSIYLNTIFNEELVLEKIDYFRDLYSYDILMHSQRWQAFNVARWHENIEVMREFARNRPYYQRQHLIEYFDLEGLINIEFIDKNNNIKINEFEFDGSYDGQYFKNIPLEIAVAYHHNFSHFEDQKGNILSEESEFIFTPESDTQIIVVYEEYNPIYIIIFSFIILSIIGIIIFYIIKKFQKIDHETDTSYHKKMIH